MSRLMVQTVLNDDQSINDDTKTYENIKKKMLLAKEMITKLVVC